MPEVVVLSDLHLGSYGCHAAEIANYLASVHPSVIVLNGDIIDIWRFRKKYFPQAHFQVVKELMKHLERGVMVYYLTGNHDEALRRFSGFRMGNLSIDNKLVLTLGGKTHWFFHGDIFDLSMKYSKWLAMLGGVAYDWLVLINRCVNATLKKWNRAPVSFSKRVKAGVKGAVKYISDFESMVLESAVSQGVDVVCCGHIHQPKIEVCSLEDQNIVYLNSGDWVESLTALEYAEGNWTLFEYAPSNCVMDVDEPVAGSHYYSLEDLLGELASSVEPAH